MIEFLKNLGFGGLYVGSIVGAVALFLFVFHHFPVAVISIVVIIGLAGVGAFMRGSY